MTGNLRASIAASLPLVARSQKRAPPAASAVARRASKRSCGASQGASAAVVEPTCMPPLDCDALDFGAVIDPPSYAQWDGLLDLFDTRREEATVARVESPDCIQQPFWLVSRYDDVMRVSKDNATFLNNPQSVVVSLT